MEKKIFKISAKQIIALLLLLCTLMGVMPLNVIAADIADTSREQSAVSDEDIQQASNAVSDAIQSISDNIEPPESENIATGKTEVTDSTLQLRLNADGASYTVIGYLSSSDTMEIPAEFNGAQGNFPVTRIEEFAFQNKTNLKKVSIPDSIEYIGSEAFSGCDKLEFEVYGNARYLGNAQNRYLYLHSAVGTDILSVEIHKDTKFIGSYAFLNCRALTEIAVPATVVQVGFKAFRHTDALKKITLPFVGEMGSGTKNAHLGYVFGAQTFGGNISYVPESLREIVILGGERLAKNSFYGVDLITSLTLPFVGATKNGTTGTNISYIYGYDSYTGNSYLPASLKNITVLGGEIPANAFSGCTGIESVTLPQDLKTINSGVFQGCSSLKDIVIPNGVNSIGNSSFKGCSSLTGINIPNSVTSIGESAFSGCSSLKDIVIPNGVNSIGSSSFKGCSSLTGINIPNSVTSIGDRAFSECDNLININIPNGITKIADSLFSFCDNLKSITLPDSVTSIGAYAFGYCGNLISVNIPDSVTSFGDSMFFSCKSLASINIPDGITEIPYSAFSGCNSLQNVVIPDSVTIIGPNAFTACKSFTSISIPKNVKSIGSSAFGSCSGLISVTIPNGVESISNSAFSYCTSLTSIDIPDSVTSIGRSAFWECSNLISIYIPDSVTSMGEGAFDNCDNLTIYCEAASQPDGWDTLWNKFFFGTVVWGYTGDIPKAAAAASYSFNDTSLLSEPGDEISTYNNVQLLSASASETEGENAIYNNIELLSSSASGTASSGLQFWLLSDGKSYEVSIGTCTDTDIIIPSIYNGLPVTGLRKYAFYGAKNVTSIYIPDSVTSIGMASFAGCSNLTSIRVPDTITDCPDGGQIDWNAFGGCSKLPYKEYENAYYIGNETNPYVILVKATSKSITSCEIHPDTKYIYHQAFYGCTGLASSISIPGSVKGIGVGAFFNCAGLLAVTIGDGVFTIEDAAFRGCTGLTSLKVPSSLKSVGDNVFVDCSKLVYNEYDNAYYLGNDETPYVILVKATSKSITSCEISATTKYIYNYAFSDCIKLTSITLPSDVTGIGDYAFYRCSNLTSINIPDNVIEIGSYAFYQCSSLTSMKFPDGITSIGQYAFVDCSNLISISIPDSVTDIGTYAFSGCTGLKTLTIGQGVKKINQRAFGGCKALTEINYNAMECADIPSSYSVFYNAGTSGSGIKLVIGANVKKIPAYLFHYNSNAYAPKIVSVEFEEGSLCVSIGQRAFYNCTSLQSIIYTGEYNEWRFIEKATNWDENAGAYELTCAPSKGLLYEMSDDASGMYVSEFDASILPADKQATTTAVKIPDIFGGRPVVEILRQAFYNCAQLTSITISDSVIRIGDYAFANCDGLASIVIHGGVTALGRGLFSGCNSLVDITVPFLGETEGDAENAYLGYMFGAFEYSVNSLYVPTSLTTVTVTGDCDIVEGAFYDCAMLSEIKFEGSPEYIGDYAFANCKKFSEFSIPDSVKRVGIGVLEGCSGITKIHIGASLEEIAYSRTEDGSKSFQELWGINKANSLLREYTVSPLNEKYSADEFGVLYIEMMIPYASAVQRKKVTVVDAPANANLSNYTFPDQIVEIRPYAFAYNGSLIEANLEYVRSIGSHAFYEADGLISVYLGEPEAISSEFWDYIEIIDYNQYIGDSAFMGCTSLQKINIDTEMLIGIGDQAFYDCEKLKTVILGKKIQVIGAEAFGASYSGKSNLEQFAVNTQNEKFISIGGVLYSYNSDSNRSLTLEWYPACLAQIDITVNADGTKTQTVKIADNKTTAYVEEFQLPTKSDEGEDVSVSSVRSYAFRTAAKLSKVNLNSASALSVGDYAFSGSSIRVIDIGSKVVSLGLKRGEGEYTVFADCQYLTEINVDGKNSYYSSIDGVLFDKKQNTLIKYPIRKGGDTTAQYTLPESVSVIASMAFKGNDALVSVSVPSYIASIGLEAFYDCSNLLIIFFDDVYAPVSVMENAFTTMCDAGTVIGYNESKYFDGKAANEYGWENYDDIYVIQTMSAIPEIDIDNSNGAYAIVIVDENGERINGVVDENGDTNFIVTLTDPKGVSETIYAGKDASGLGDGVAVFYDLYGMVKLGFSIDYEGTYSLRVSDTMGAYYSYVAEEFYLDGDMRITYVTLVHKPCNIVFNANGGEGSFDDLPVTVGVNSELPTEGISRPGYTFRGWSNTPDGSVDYPAGIFYAEKYREHFVLYAVWEANTNTVKFDANGGSGSMADILVKTGETVTLPANVYTAPSGYNFGGWSVQMNDSTTEYIAANSGDPLAFTSGPESEYTLSAIWIGLPRDIVFHANGGVGSMDKQTATTDTKLALNVNDNKITRPGYVFKGWSTTPTGTVSYADGHKNYSVTDVAVQVLYAVWEANTNTVKFDANGGVGNMTQITAKTDERITLPKSQFTRSGYILVGWAESATSGLLYDATGSYTMASNDTTLYAVWTKGPAVYGVSCNEVDINTQTTTINKKEFGKIYDGVELIDPKKGYAEGNFRYIGEHSEELTVSVIGYFDSSYLSLVENGCMLYQNGKAISGCALNSERTSLYNDSAVLYFTVPVDSLEPETPIEARITVANDDDYIVATTFLNIDVIDFTVSEDDIKIDSSDLSVDISQGGDMLAMLIGSGKWNFKLNDNIETNIVVDGSKVTASLNAKYSKTNQKNHGKDYESGYKANVSGSYHDSTWRFETNQRNLPMAFIVDKDGVLHKYSMNIYFANSTASSGYCYYRCSINEELNGGKQELKNLFYGVVNAGDGRSSCVLKANLIYLAYFAQAIEKQDVTKGFEYSETVLFFSKNKQDVDTSSNKHTFDVNFYGDIVFQYQKDKGLVPVTSEIKGEVKYSFEHKQQLAIWVIPIYLQINVDLNGNICIELKYDEWRGVEMDKAQLTLKAAITAKAGLGCEVVSAGVNGSIGTVFILDFAPQAKVNKWTVSGKMSLYATFYTLKWKKGRWGIRYPAFTKTTKEHELIDVNKTLIGTDEQAQTANALMLSSMFLADSYSAADPESLEEQAVMFVRGGEVYKVYFVNCLETVSGENDGEYDTYNCRKLALSKWISASFSWSDPQVLDDNGLNDLAFHLYESDGKVTVAYTQQSSKVDESSAEDTYEYVSDLIVKQADLTDILTDETANIIPELVASGEYYKYLVSFAVMDGTPVIVWAENSDNNMFGVSPYNYISGDSIDNAENHIFETKANSVWMSKYNGTTWSEAERVVDGLSAITDMAVSDEGVIAYIVDANGNLADVEDRELYLYDVSDRKAELSEMKQGQSALNIDTEDGGFVLYCSTEGANSIEYLGLESATSDMDLPEDTSMLSDEYRILYDSKGIPMAILYVQNKSWEDAGETVDGAAIYGMFNDGEGWGMPVEISTDLISPVANYYISSFDAAWSDEQRNSVVILAEYVDDNGTPVQAITDEYMLSSDISFGEYTVNYTAGTLTLTVANNGALPTEIYALVGEARIPVCEKIMSGESIECTLDISGYGNTPVLRFYEAGSNDVLYTIADIDLAHSDLRPYVKQLLLGTQNKLLVAVKNQGNIAASGKLYVAIGNYTAETIKQAANAVQVDSLAPGDISYFELALVDGLAVDENTLATIYVESEDGTEKGECVANDLIYDTLKKYEKAVADDGTSYVPQVHSVAVTYAPKAPEDISIEYSCSATDAIASVANGTTVLSHDSYDISNEGVITLKQAYLATLAAGEYNIIMTFKSGAKISVALKVLAYYTVKWVDVQNNNEIALSDPVDVVEGSIAEFEGVPEKDSTAEYTYVFEGWDVDGDGAVDGMSVLSPDTMSSYEVTYTAVWRAEARKYTVTWQLSDDNGVINIPEMYAYGKTPSYGGSYIAPVGMKFSAWDKAVSAVSGDATYTAVYEKSAKGTAHLTNTAFVTAPGMSFTTTLSLSNIAGMSSTEITVYYDKQVASLTSLSVHDNVKCKEQGDGYIVLAVEVADDQMPLVDITFTAGASLEVGSHSLLTVSAADTIENGTDKVVIYNIGDVNVDGFVNTRDVAMVRQYVVGKLELNEVQLYYANAYADTNADGGAKINTRDVARLQQYVVKNVETIG